MKKTAMISDFQFFFLISNFIWVCLFQNGFFAQKEKEEEEKLKKLLENNNKETVCCISWHIS